MANRQGKFLAGGAGQSTQASSRKIRFLVEHHIPSIEALPILQAHKLGVSVVVKSKVLGEEIIFAPKPAPSTSGRVVYSWREAFIIAQAKPTDEQLRHLHVLKREFPGSELEAINPVGVDVLHGVKVKAPQKAAAPATPPSRPAAPRKPK